jgi:hypothetical protein
LIGAVALIRSAPNEAVILAMPVAFTLAAASFEMYPIFQRTILFWLPVAILVVAAGVVSAASIVKRNSLLAFGIIALVVCAVPAATSAKHLLFPYQREEIRPLLSHLATAWREGDSLYLSPRAQYAVRYYIECDCLDLPGGTETVPWDFETVRQPGSAQYSSTLLPRRPDLLVGTSQATLSEYIEQLDPLRGQERAWLLVTRTSPPERALLQHLSCVGRQVETLGHPTAAGLYLYDLTTWRTVGEGCGHPKR